MIIRVVCRHRARSWAPWATPDLRMLLFAYLSAAAVPDLSALQARLDRIAVQYNTSYSVGVMHSEFGAFGVASGLADKVGGAKATTESRYPVGSVTKTWTAAAVLQLHERGLVDIDASVAQYVDAILTRENGTTMAALWTDPKTGVVDPFVHKITARLLMGMRAGLHDYNDTWYYDVTMNDPTYDVTPYDILHRLNKTFVCEPGLCGKYASPGFEILGLLVAQMTGATRWEEYDQLSVLPPALRGDFTRTAFPLRGICADVPHIVHQYAAPFWSSTDGGVQKIIDFYYDSCLNGWSCGNLAAGPIDIARFHYHLHNYDIVTRATVESMMQWEPMSIGWDPQLYGLAMMQTWPTRGWAWGPDPLNETYLVGHGGADYGSTGIVSGWNPMHKFGISVTSNSAGPLNCR